MNNIVNTKVKFVRNLSGVAFSTKISSKTESDVLKLSLDACNELGLKGESLSNISDTVLDQLIVAGKLEPEFIKTVKNKGFIESKNASIQINGINHIEIFSNNLDIFDAYREAKQVDKLLCNKLHFSYNDKYGFLSPEIDKIGSGMQISIIMLLPALNKMDAIKDLPKFSDKLRFNIRAIDLQSGLYLISTGANLGYSEKQICELTNNYIQNILKAEVEFSKTLATDELEIIDKNLRAKAIINSCAKISINELYGLVGDILIAINSGLEKGVDSKHITKILECIKDIKSTSVNDLAKLIKGILT